MSSAKQQAWTKVTACGLYPAAMVAGDDNGAPPDPKEIEICRAWIRACAEPTKRMRARSGSSYGLKHVVEEWTMSYGPHRQVDDRGSRWTAPYHYVSNGAFIEAARLEGYRVVRDGSGSPNAVFNMKVLAAR